MEEMVTVTKLSDDIGGIPEEYRYKGDEQIWKKQS